MGRFIIGIPIRASTGPEIKMLPCLPPFLPDLLIVPSCLPSKNIHDLCSYWEVSSIQTSRECLSNGLWRVFRLRFELVQLLLFLCCSEDRGLKVKQDCTYCKVLLDRGRCSSESRRKWVTPKNIFLTVRNTVWDLLIVDFYCVPGYNRCSINICWMSEWTLLVMMEIKSNHSSSVIFIMFSLFSYWLSYASWICREILRLKHKNTHPSQQHALSPIYRVICNPHQYLLPPVNW